jgi:Cu-Zn family superoxide dismutase
VRLVSEADATAAGSAIRIAIVVSGLTPGDHGLALHERGECSGVRAADAGRHWNPTGERHGGPHDKTRHLGDLGNLHVGADGRGRAVLRFRFPHDDRGDARTALIGKTVVVHERADDLKTDPDGGAGPAVACGAIERTDAVAH